ncbi:procathepsin L-like isoform X2 [Pristis pectinata]|uniref:procathepsin L-like isoform X2 n=1 Tax=Pristis pectinata TaxID=685728 RepID=UPI00223D4CE7|nr:procathepsin L-like isoform X2 [Pristis pectinata]
MGSEGGSWDAAHVFNWDTPIVQWNFIKGKIISRFCTMKFSLFLGFVAGSILVVASDHKFSSALDEEWENWKLQYSKQYSEGEEINRRMIWESAMSYIEQHNREYSLGKHTFTVAMNQFGDLTNEEFNTLMNGFLMNEAENSTEEEAEEYDGLDDDNEDGLELPSTVDWRTKGLVTPVKNQGQCGSCWAFSATGALEGQWKKKKNQLISLSEQNLLDCDRRSHGCRGGYMRSAFACVKRLRGINSERTYPYTAQGYCKFQRRRIAARLQTYGGVKRREYYLARAIAAIGPISVAVNARHRSFQYYSRGVYYERRCNSRIVNHAVLAVGYGRENGVKYWLIKNSWGTTWGDNGYIKMVKDRNNNCGIANYMVFPIV